MRKFLYYRFWSLNRNVVCNGPVSCKVNGVGNQLGRGDIVIYQPLYVYMLYIP